MYAPPKPEMFFSYSVEQGHPCYRAVLQRAGKRVEGTAPEYRQQVTQDAIQHDFLSLTREIVTEGFRRGIVAPGSSISVHADFDAPTQSQMSELTSIVENECKRLNAASEQRV
jgi:hypothetical protein